MALLLCRRRWPISQTRRISFIRVLNYLDFFSPRRSTARCALAVAFVLLTLTRPVSAEPGPDNDISGEENQHSQLSCSVITSEHLTILQLYQRGLSLEEALEAFPDASKAGKQRMVYVYQLVKNIGILNTYSDINSNFARCSTRVYKKHGKPARDLLEYGYYFCAGENKIRYELILNIDRYHSIEKVLTTVPDSHRNIAINYYNLVTNKGLLAAFDYTANNFKACINNLQQSAN